MPLHGESKREYDRQWMRARREVWFEVNGPCVKCGSWERLELDHKDPSTKVASAIWSWTEVKRLEELAKCQVLCEACHMEKTIMEKTKTVVHGTHHGYDRGCRCVECKAAYALYRRDYRKRVGHH